MCRQLHCVDTVLASSTHNTPHRNIQLDAGLQASSFMSASTLTTPASVPCSTTRAHTRVRPTTMTMANDHIPTSSHPVAAGPSPSPLSSCSSLPHLLSNQQHRAQERARMMPCFPFPPIPLSHLSLAQPHSAHLRLLGPVRGDCSVPTLQPEVEVEMMGL